MNETEVKTLLTELYTKPFKYEQKLQHSIGMKKNSMNCKKYVNNLAT